MGGITDNDIKTFNNGSTCNGDWQSTPSQHLSFDTIRHFSYEGIQPLPDKPAARVDKSSRAESVLQRF